MEFIEHPTSFDADEYIFKEGEAGDCAYIIDSGMVEVSTIKGGRKLVIATLAKGEILGEMAIIDQLPRSASALAILPTQVTVIPHDYLSQKIDKSDPTVRLFLRHVMARYRDLTDRLCEVFEGLSPDQEAGQLDEYASTTMELKSVMSQYEEMQKRIDSAVTKPARNAGESLFGEATLMDTKILATEDIRLKSALVKKEFLLHYQPIVELASNRIVGCESLVRWKHPSGQLFPPSGFIAQTEDSGLIIELGYWIAEEACRFQSRLLNEFQQNLFFAINLSGKQFEDESLIPKLTDIMDRSGARREQIKFEITESLLMDNPELASRWLQQLKATGVKLAIDDFGTGYSSFSYLHSFPFDTLKIDRVFVSAMLRNKKSNQIVKSLVNLSHNLGMDVVAEGIESEQEAELMRQYNTRYAQGFYFSKAVTESEFIELLQRKVMKLAD